MKTTEFNLRINDTINLKGNLNIPRNSGALVIFSHGSGSSSFSSRNSRVAEILNENKIATLLIDLLNEKEDSLYQNHFNVDLLTKRLIMVTELAMRLSELKNLNIGYFGANTGAASALSAAAWLPGLIGAVVSPGGRPDLAYMSLHDVKAPTLLVIGSLDPDVIQLNEQACSKLKCEKEIQIVKGATHLFEEPGKLDEVASLAVDWFKKHLVLHPVTIFL
jgi:putative phosphoribosyl transferase